MYKSCTSYVGYMTCQVTCSRRVSAGASSAACGTFRSEDVASSTFSCSRDISHKTLFTETWVQPYGDCLGCNVITKGV